MKRLTVLLMLGLIFSFNTSFASDVTQTKTELSVTISDAPAVADVFVIAPSIADEAAIIFVACGEFTRPLDKVGEIDALAIVADPLLSIDDPGQQRQESYFEIIFNNKEMPLHNILSQTRLHDRHGWM